MTEILGYASTVSIQVVILFLMIAVGYIISKKGLINGEGAMQMTNTLIYIVTPCVIIHSFEKMDFSAEAAGELLIAAVCAIATHAIGFLVSFLIFYKNKKQLRTLLVCNAALSNCGFMGVPLAEALLGDRGVFLISVYIAIFNIFVWTLGFAMFSEGKFNLKKAIINPGVIGTAIGFALFFAKLNLPSVISSPISFLANLNSPLAMIVIGYYLSSSPMKPTKGDGKLLLSIALRLVAIPLICLAVFRICEVRGDLLTACVIPSCAPGAAIVMMFAAKFGGDTKIASKGMSYSHIIAVITMPLIMAVCKIFI